MPDNDPPDPQDFPEDFAEFMKRREQTARAYVAGDAVPLRVIAAREEPASFFGPGGGHVMGADAVWTTHESGAAHFAPGGDTNLQILHMGASHGLGYWVGVQHATVQLRGESEARPMDLRVTEIFRRDGDSWKLIHRHADLLVEPAARK
jgi:ketosteroid isomerase-like protein